MIVNIELQMGNSLDFCKDFCNRQRKGKERGELKKKQANQQDKLKTISQQKLST